MVLDRYPANFFAETEQVAFHPGNLVPGIDVTPDPLLQGRLFSYQDTQLIRLGGPNFHQIPINAPVCPFRNFQRDGHMQMQVPAGPRGLRAQFARSRTVRARTRTAASRASPILKSGPKLRKRPETFADHYSQARQF